MKKRSSYSQKQRFSFVEEWIASGDSQERYCSSKNISRSSFGNWIKSYRLKNKIPAGVRTLDHRHFICVELEDQGHDLIGTAQRVSDSEFAILSTETYSDIQITYAMGTILKIGSEVSLDQLRMLLTLV